ncbi:MAG: SpvB/TcaC N-terminal domain-containing protein, partial [Acidimicrobiia bacterium]
MLSPHRHRHRHLLPLVAALLLATLLPGIAAADPADPGGPPDVSGGVELDGSVVRSEAPPALPLTLEADESAVSWDLPFELPAGGGGVEPSLGLSYSSAAGRGLAGVGTSVSGLSVVARCQSTFGSDGVVRPVRWDLSDQLCLDGDRLVKVGGTHGRSGSSYRLRADDGRMVELSGDISSPSSVFRVFNTDGSVSTYGGGSAREGRVDGSGSVLPLRWWIESWTDPTGNRVRYEYESGPAEPGELTPDFRPVRVSWGANDGAGVGFTRGVSFGYVPSGPEPWAQDYEHGARSVRTSVISRVEVVADGEVVRSYRVGYTDDEDGVPDPGPVPPNQPRPPILPQPRWLTVCDRAGVCAPRTDIGWLRSPSAWEEREGDLGFEGQQIHPFVPQAPLEPVGGSLVDTSVWADFDGDGDPDLLVAPQRLASNVDPQWELYAMDAAPTTVVGTGLPVAWQAPWRAELTDDPSWAWEPSVARPAQPIEDDGTPGAELLVGRAAERLGGVFAYAPWGLGGESDVWSTRLVWDDDDGWVEEGWKEARSFDGHPGILSELEVVGVDGGVWSTRELGWSSSDMAGHGLLWHRTGDFDGDGLTDLVVCASSVDTDAWYEQHGKETEFDRFGTDPFLGGQLRLALGSLDGLSLADGGRAVGGGTCGWDDWVYVAPSLEGDGRDQLLQLGARDRAGAAVPPSERAANFTAWRFAPGEQVLASWDSGLPREADEFMRWTGSAGNEAESYTTAADGHELSGHGLRFPGMGEIRFGDVNGDGLADALGVELGAGQDPDLVYEDPRENGFEDEDPLPGRVRVWWNTGTGFVRGPGLDAGFEDTWSWRLQFGSSSIADVNGDGTEDLVYSYQDLTDASIVLQDLGAGAATWVVVTDGDDNDGIHTWFGRPGGLTPGPSLASSTGTVTWSGSSSGVDHRVLALDVDRNGTPDVAQFDPLASRWTFLQARASTGHLDQDGLAGDRVWSLTDGNGRQDLVTWTVDHVSATTTQATPAYPLAARPSTAVVPAALHADSGLDHDGGRVPVSTRIRAWDRTYDRRRGAGLGPRVAEAVTTEGTGSGRVET